MSEELLKAIIRLFAIVAKERITDEERANIKEFLSLHLNQAATDYYLNLFENYVAQYEIEGQAGLENVDDETLEFVDEWRNIIKITKEVNKALTLPQKMVLVVKIIELIFADGAISERQENLIHYIGDSLKISQKDLNTLKLFVTGEDYEELAHKDILIIDESLAEDFEYLGPHMETKNLTGLLAILRVPESETYFVKYLGISMLYLNAIPLRSRMVDVFPTGSTIRGTKIETIYYSDVVNRFLAGEEYAKITFSAEHLFYHFRSGRAGIQNVNIAEEGGKLIGLMGASGSGKSTLLNVLNGAEKPTGGRVIINGINIHEDTKLAEGIVGYVPQDDYLIAELTVFENLYYAARLSFKDNSEEENIEIINKVLANLGLSETKNLKVGSPMDKTISGGQRKRLNIGLELLREPSVLFVDEPTSGLSSSDSENIMDLLKELSFRGKMVFVVIHQPSSDIFKLFDSLLVLDVGGFQIYYGNPVESIIYFKEIINAANKSQSECPECGNINPEQIFNIIETRVVNEFGRLTDVRKVSPGQWYQYFKEHVTVPAINHVKEKIAVTRRVPGRFSQTFIYFIRDIKAKLANHQYLAINLLEAPVLAIFMAFMVRYFNAVEEGTTYSFYKNENMPVYFFMCIIVALFMGLTVSAEEIFRDRLVRKRERFLNLSRSSYLVAKIFVLFIFSAIQTITFVLIGDMILDINGMEPRLWLILFSASCFANLMGLNISSSFDSAVTIYILIPLLLIPQLLLSGVVINFDKFNPKVSNLESVPFFGEVMASRWAFEAALVTQFKDNPYERELFPYEQDMAEASYMQIYYIQKLESALSFCFNNIQSTSPDVRSKVAASLSLLKEELLRETGKLDLNFEDKINKLEPRAFNASVYNELNQLLKTLGQLYVTRYDKAERALQKKKSEMISRMGSEEAFDSLMFRYRNERIVRAVRNMDSEHRIIRVGNKLVRKTDPIYIKDIHPDDPFDFRAPFYSPKKHFAGLYFDTLWFNISVIWLMTIVLYITLYFDVLRRIVGLTLTNKRKKLMRQLK